MRRASHDNTEQPASDTRSRISSAARPVRPRLPITISDAPTSLATSTTRRCGEPCSIRITGSSPLACISATAPSATPRAARRRERSRRSTRIAPPADQHRSIRARSAPSPNADAPEHHPGGTYVPCDPTATRSATRFATPPNSAATSRPLIKIGVIDGNPSVVWRSAARDSWRSWCITSSAAVPAGIASPGSHADNAQHFAPSSASATAWRTATMLCSDASTPHSTFRKVTGRCEPDRSTSSASDTARAYCESVRSHRVRRRGPRRLSTLSPIITTRVPLTTPDTGDPTELDAPIEPRGCPSARCGNARVPTARRERRPGVLATLRSAE